MTDKVTAAAEVILRLAEEARLAQESDARTQAINAALTETLVQRDATIAQLQFSLSERDATILAMQVAKAADETGERDADVAKDRTIAGLRAELDAVKAALANAQAAPKPPARQAPPAPPAPPAKRAPEDFKVRITARDGNNRASEFRITSV